VTSALCASSRTVALTGLCSHTSGILGNDVGYPLPNSVPLVTELLQKTEYDIAMVGKVHAPFCFRDRALAWLQEDRNERPFCLCLWHQTPHAPFYRPRKYLDLYNGMGVAKPDTFDDDSKGYRPTSKDRASASAGQGAEYGVRIESLTIGSGPHTRRVQCGRKDARLRAAQFRNVYENLDWGWKYVGRAFHGF
jgi:arylsulfatase A-like enzyme